MPTSKKQIEANQKNAQKSTGPKSNKGKEIVSNNVTRHGLYAKDLVINSPHLKENEEDYELLLSALIEELKPTTEFQNCLVQKIANCLWRSQRAIRAETAEINAQLRNVDREIQRMKTFGKIRGFPMKEKDDDTVRANLINKLSLPKTSTSFNILRYEMRLDRQISRAYQLLIHLQSMRQLENVRNKREIEDNS
ncbi:MAG: hypothetical protein V3V99_05455 [candidate division Zixibacteria bacterium]